ncbi:MAG: AmmeMemoRadiSam system protein B [Leptospiraceae bacterium]|nr:AmmeMemoRadiSam system protein B [Leptospiraceae bacterium]
MSRTRYPAVAGQFYPDQMSSLQGAVDQYLKEGQELLQSRHADLIARSDQLRALIAPHAGYIYSGPIAGSAWALLANSARFQQVLIVGPAHHYPVSGVVLPAATRLMTPLGAIAISTQLVARLAARPCVQVLDIAHQKEHSMEVHLPFMQRVLGDVPVAIAAVGKIDQSEMAELLAEFVLDPSTLLVVSSDLSHFLNAQAAGERDRATSARICAAAAGQIGPQDACGSSILNGLLEVVRAHNLICHELDRRTSADTAGSPERVVGYGAWAVFE